MPATDPEKVPPVVGCSIYATPSGLAARRASLVTRTLPELL